MSGKTVPWTKDAVDYKAPTAELIKEISWVDFLESGASIADSAWEIVNPPDAALVLESDTVIEDDTIAQVLVTGGTPGKTYTVTNTITTDETPPQIDAKSFLVVIAEQ